MNSPAGQPNIFSRVNRSVGAYSPVKLQVLFPFFLRPLIIIYPPEQNIFALGYHLLAQ